MCASLGKEDFYLESKVYLVKTLLGKT